MNTLKKWFNNFKTTAWYGFSPAIVFFFLLVFIFLGAIISK